MSIPSILSKYSLPPPSRSPGRLNFQSWQLPPFVNFVRFCKKMPLALFVFVFSTGVGFYTHGFRYFKLFVPAGVPTWLLPLLVPIEFISYLSRPVSLSVRLFANMTAGHVMWEVFAGFMLLLTASFGILGVFASVVPLGLNVALVALELLVAGLQAYVFAILTCLYLHDAVHMH